MCLVLAALFINVSYCVAGPGPAPAPIKAPPKGPQCAKGATPTRCGCSDGKIPIARKGVGGTYTALWDHAAPGWMTIDAGALRDLLALNEYPEFRGFIDDAPYTIPGYTDALLDPKRTETICTRLIENPWTFIIKDRGFPGGKRELCKLEKPLNALILLCHEFGHYKQCWDHQHSLCEDECEQYTRGAEIARKCNARSQLQHNLTFATVTCGASLGRCFIGKDSATDESPGSCLEYCVKSAVPDTAESVGAIGGGAAAVAEELRKRTRDCDRAMSYYRNSCATTLPFAVCGDGTCQGSEDPTSCPLDCSSKCGNGRCEHDEEMAKSCPLDCCTPNGVKLTPTRPQCCPEDHKTLIVPYNGVCLRCAPEGTTPQLSHRCCTDEGFQELSLVNGVCTRCIDWGQTKTKAPCCSGLNLYGQTCRDCAIAGETPKGQDSCCAEQKLVPNKDGICTVEPACVLPGEPLPVGRKCCGGLGTVGGKCFYCIKQGEKVNTDPRLAAPQCCDGLSPAKRPDGSTTCEKASPPAAGGGGNTTNCIAPGQPCSPYNGSSCCNGGAAGCKPTAGGKYQCS